MGWATKKRNSQKGQAAITAVLFLIAISLVVGSGFASLGIRQTRSSRVFVNSVRSFASMESGLEDVMFRLSRQIAVDSSETLTLNGGNVVTTNDEVDSEREIIAQADVASLIQKTRVVMSGGPGIEYGYGIQVGEGGFCMDNNSDVIGDVYTTGDVLGPGAGGCDRSGGSGSVELQGNVSVANGFQDDPDDETEGGGYDEYYDSTQIFGKTSPIIDIAQKFRFDSSGPAGRLWLFLRKVGNPQPLEVRVVRNVSGRPSANPNDIMASTTIPASQVLPFYTFADVMFTTSTTLQAGTDYWFVLDASQNTSNYYEIGRLNDSSSNQKATADSANPSAVWSDISGGDFSYRIWRGGVLHKIDDMDITGTAWAHTVTNSNVSQSVSAWSVNNTDINGSVWANSIQNCSVDGDAYYNTEIGCSIWGARHTPITPLPDPPYAPFSLISPAQFQAWHDEAFASSTQSCSGGEYQPADGATIGPKYIPCDLHIRNGRKVKLGGTVWVDGNVFLDENSVLMLAPSFGTLSGALIGERPLGEDSHTHIVINQNVTICGSEGYSSSTQECYPSNNSFIHFIYLNEPLRTSIHIENNVQGRAVFYDPHGRIKIHENAQVRSVVVGFEFYMYENSLLEFDQAMQDVGFTTGPPGAFLIKDWRVVE